MAGLASDGSVNLLEDDMGWWLTGKTLRAITVFARSDDSGLETHSQYFA